MGKLIMEHQTCRLFGDVLQRIRYACAMAMVFLMVGMAELLGEKEVIFPELAALAVGLWIVDKRVWKVGRWQILLLMTAGAFAGVCIVRYMTFPLWVNLSLAFLFAALCLMVFRSTLIPLLSACIARYGKLGLSVGCIPAVLTVDFGADKHGKSFFTSSINPMFFYISKLA